MNVGPVILSNPRQWTVWGVVTGGAGLLFGAPAAALTGAVLLPALMFTSAQGGDAMLQLSSAGSAKR